MDCSKMGEEWQYIERNGVCFNIDEKMRCNLAIQELKSDLGLEKMYFIAKVSGKLTIKILLIPSVTL